NGSWSGAITISGGHVTTENLATSGMNVTMSSGSLSVQSGSMTIETLSLSGGEVTGAGTLKISSSLLWTGGPFYSSLSSMSGTGTTVLEHGASGTIKQEVIHLSGSRRLLNEATI